MFFFLLIADLIRYKNQNKMYIIYCSLILEIFHIFFHERALRIVPFLQCALAA